MVYGRPGLKVYQDMWFLWETWFQGIPGCAVFMGHLVLRYMWFIGHQVARKISFPRLHSSV